VHLLAPPVRKRKPTDPLHAPSSSGTGPSRLVLHDIAWVTMHAASQNTIWSSTSLEMFLPLAFLLEFGGHLIDLEIVLRCNWTFCASFPCNRAMILASLFASKMSSVMLSAWIQSCLVSQ
jgi:hypothetical protein